MQLVHLHDDGKSGQGVWSKPRTARQILVVDAGYYNSEDLKACEDDGIKAYVPMHEGNGKLEKQGRFVPQGLQPPMLRPIPTVVRLLGQLLHPMESRLQTPSGRIEISLCELQAICDTCQLRARCPH